MKNILFLNPEIASEEEIKSYSVRKAVRAVVIDKDNNVGLVYVAKSKHYKVPGGGIEKGENKEETLRRECQEEIGTDIEVVGELGSVTEYRKMWKLTQISYCYLAKVKGKKGMPNYMKDEIHDGFEPVWLPYEKALEAFIKNKGDTFEAKEYIVPRDSAVLEKAMEILKGLN